MDVYSITDKGKFTLSGSGKGNLVMRKEGELHNYDFWILYKLRSDGPTDYQELLEQVTFQGETPSSVNPYLRRALRRLFEAGLIDRMER